MMSSNVLRNEGRGSWLKPYFLNNSSNFREGFKNVDIHLRDAFKKKIAQKVTLEHSHLNPPLAIGTNYIFLEVS